jgi:hypothetical protein
MTGRIKDLSVDRQGKTILMLEINERQAAETLYDELNLCEKCEISVKKWRGKRSLNANNYTWKLLTEIGNVLRLDKEVVYLEMLKRYGQSEIVSVLAHIPIREYMKYCEEAGESTLHGKLFKHYKVYKGSSEFDTREMSIFLDGVVSEAKELGIQTETPDQIAELKARWGE